MTGVNRAILLGHIGREPEISRTSSGNPCARLSLATSKTWRDESGERRERTEWHQIVVFNEAMVMAVERFVHTGSRIYVEGEIQTREWTDAAGTKRRITEIVLGPFGSSLKLMDRAERAPDRDEDAAPAGPADAEGF